MPIRVLVADDHTLVREALKELLTSAPGIEVVGECSDGDEVGPAVAATRPHVVLLDVQMPRMDGLQAAALLLESHPDVRVLMVTGALTAKSAAEARALGVAGYLLKSDDPALLADHVRTVASGGVAWNSEAAALAAHGAGGRARAATGTSSVRLDESPRRLR
ncbi:response regulator transcription factor [Geodermatophilus sp. SYSU D00697]